MVTKFGTQMTEMEKNPNMMAGKHGVSKKFIVKKQIIIWKRPLHIIN